jgi:hypothetical protein
MDRTAPTDTATNTQPATIVVQLSGEMGNQLSRIAHGHALFLWLKRDFGIDATIVLRHQEKPKWLTARDNVQKCFPATRSYDFSAANTLEFENRSRQQSAWLGSSLEGINNPESVANVSRALQLFAQFNRTEVQQRSSSNSSISLPFLYSDLLVMGDLFMDRFYNDYRELFRFDPACCQHRPESDESVFVSVVRQTTSLILWCFAHYFVRCVLCLLRWQHFRNYLREMPRKGRLKGYEELSPNQTAHQLFGHLGRGDKVAITTRFDTSAAGPYVEALERRGIQVRVVTNQTDTQDFCFLMQAQKEMVGLTRSTFFLWAGFLGNCSRVRAYSVDSPDRRQAVPNVFDHYNWTNPELQSRVFFELHKADPNERRYLL